MKVDALEQEYWWEIKAFFEEPTKKNLAELLQQVYETGVSDGAYLEAERWKSGYYD